MQTTMDGFEMPSTLGENGVNLMQSPYCDCGADEDNQAQEAEK